ncbi:Type 4 prepilin-like proteins leader peptide-processing enzyme [Roseovarius litorisediminis]|uniref:Prepilin leader peptidase/N-methyltransferase n=1 Tax=Roseovarius litorisediminis TaxID=1312363 RepID=A0A1Y5ST14_9RHOB|nr:A24 family peptidase [Roseovarius litorisediminis]SLN47762.1 Type 4 prepilin-like proteins leader peptide-processing enzyme [Roseovarius litorisediminis]
MTHPLPLAVFLILIGPAVGSFMALLADRLPLGENVMTHPSQCRTCGKGIAWRDKIPVFSYLSLGGKCRHCGQAIPARLFYAEITGAVLAILAVSVAFGPTHMVLGAAFLWTLFGLALCDLAAFRLPNALTSLLFLIGMALVWEDPSRHINQGVLAAAAGAGSFWLIRIVYKSLRRREGLGLGDVKLMAGIGAALGISAIPVVTLVAALLALLVTAINARRHEQPLEGEMAIPFGAFLSAAAALVFVVG